MGQGLKVRTTRSRRQSFRGARWLRSPQFRPDHRRPDRWDTWWLLPPRLVREYLAILGFTDAVVTWHRQIFRQRTMWLYTVVARKPRLS